MCIDISDTKKKSHNLTAERGVLDIFEGEGKERDSFEVSKDDR